MAEMLIVKPEKSQYFKDYYMAHRDIILENQKQYYVQNRGQRTNYQKQYSLENMDSVKEYQSNYRLAHKGNNTERIREQKRNWARKKAIEKKLLSKNIQ
jgi:hypothetical protein